MRADADIRYTPTLRERFASVRSAGLLILQLCASAALAWLVAHDLVGHEQPFFAPIAATITVTVGFGQRRAVAVELVAGASIGILVGELIVLGIGHGAWQLAVVVALAMGLTILVGVGGVARTQAAISAILIATVTPVGGTVDPAVDRFVDALIGGGVGLVVAFLLPINPIRMLGGQVQTVVGELTTVLRNVATSVRWSDPGPAWTALQQARGLQPRIESLTAASESAREVSRMSPLRWVDRDQVLLYTSSIRWLDYAVRDARVLARRVETMTRRRVPSPAGLAQALSDLADAVEMFAAALDADERFDEVRTALVQVARTATATLRSGSELSAVSTVAQVRALCADLLYAIGVSQAEVDELFEPPEEPDSAGAVDDA